MDDPLETLGALIALIFITILAWLFYTFVVMVVLVGLFSTVSITFQFIATGTPLPEWWWIALFISAFIGAIEFYDNIVKGT